MTHAEVEDRCAYLISTICSEELSLKVAVDTKNRTREATIRGHLRTLWAEYGPLPPPVVVER